MESHEYEAPAVEERAEVKESLNLVASSSTPASG